VETNEKRKTNNNVYSSPRIPKASFLCPFFFLS
jgi:hypothetical protein